jgi:hypothetical protein
LEDIPLFFSREIFLKEGAELLLQRGRGFQEADAFVGDRALAFLR